MKSRQIVGLMVFLLLLVALAGGGLVLFISRQIQQIDQRTVGPIQQVNQDMATRVARFLEPTPTIIPDPVSIIHEIRSLARLETIQYSVEKVITADSGQEELKALFGDKLLFVAHGEVIAGIDLEKIALEDVKLDGKAIKIKLPPAEVLITRLDNEKSYVYDRQTGLLVRQNMELETKARQTAEQEIYKTAVEDGILKQAQTNAENYLDRLIRSMGYEEVIFTRP
ncbi:MAG TPA: DUF4230 domain-containing protein [Leptolinea sp.]